MSIKIHHGPPGSYKTAGAMGDDFLREAKAGRVIVTNVRGVTRERVLDEFPDLPDTFDVIHLDDKTPEDRQKWARWFHWAPPGAFIFVDEAQMIWPKSWREADIRALDYPGGLDASMKDDRPATWSEAFEKHRHWNWDMVFTTPNYKKIRDDIKECAEMAYKHKNLAVVGIGGRYIEAAHLADDSGSSQSDFVSVNQKKVPSYVFRIYDSTATGSITDTKTGISLFKNPRVFLLLVVLVGCLVMVAGRGVPKVIGGSAAPSVGVSPSGSADRAPGAASSPSKADRFFRDGNAYGGAVAGAPVVMPFDEAEAFIVANLKMSGGWRYMVSLSNYQFSSAQIEEMGYTVRALGSCAMLLKYRGVDRLIVCGSPKRETQVDRGEGGQKAVPESSKEVVTRMQVPSNPAPMFPGQVGVPAAPVSQVVQGEQPPRQGTVPVGSPVRFGG